MIRTTVYKNYLAPSDQCSTVYVGIDPGIVNIGLCVLAEINGGVKLLLLEHIDLGSEAVKDDNALFKNILNLFDSCKAMFSLARPNRYILDIEMQAKQTDEARMIMVAGAIKTCFTARFASFMNGEIHNQSPGCATCMELQRYIELPDDQKNPVSRREEKKEQIDLMLAWWLQSKGLDWVNDEMINKLAVRKKGHPDEFVKSKDRRNHVGDAWGQAMYNYMRNNPKPKVVTKRKREE